MSETACCYSTVLKQLLQYCNLGIADNYILQQGYYTSTLVIELSPGASEHIRSQRRYRVCARDAHIHAHNAL